MGEFKCFRCNSDLKDPSAYITKERRPVCAECLPKLCDSYWWDEESSRLRRVRRGRFEPLRRFGPEEIEREVGFILATIPPIREGKSGSSWVEKGGRLDLPSMPSLE